MANTTITAAVARRSGARGSRRTLLGAAALALCAALLVPLARVSADSDTAVARVSHLDGTATLLTTDGSTKPLERGSAVRAGQTVETGPSSKLELKLPDDSVVRLGPSSKLLLREVHFGGGNDRRFSAKLAFGKVWSKVTRTLGGEAKFEVETDNAVAGVRGTTFRVDANRDRSVLVRVYAGAVAMAPGAALPTSTAKGRKGRVQVAGPKQISRAEWEVLVGRMMSLTVNADGTPGEAVAFTEEEEAGDEWVTWNKQRDGE